MTNPASEPKRIRETIDSAIRAAEWELARARLSRLAALAGDEAGLDEVEKLRHMVETALVGEQDWTASAARWKSVLRDFPDEPSLWPFAARAFIQTADFVEADAVMERLCAHQPENFESWMYFALNAESQHLWPAAVERWDRVIQLNPDDANIKMLRGDAIWNASMQEIGGAEG